MWARVRKKSAYFHVCMFRYLVTITSNYILSGYALLFFRIFSDKGLPYLEKEFPKLKFKGRGHEVY